MDKLQRKNMPPLLAILLPIVLGPHFAGALIPPASIPGNTIDIIKSYGFVAEEHHVVTKDGYILLAIRVVNPLANAQIVARRYNPVLLNHGILFSSSDYVLQGNNTRPDLPPTNSSDAGDGNGGPMAQHRFSARSFGGSPHKLSPMNIVDRAKKLNDEHPDERVSSLPLILSNNLFDVWLLNGRGLNYYRSGLTSGANNTRIFRPMLPDAKDLPNFVQTGNNYHVNKSITYGDYWNFSLDQQALYDLPAFVEYVQQVTKWNKVSYIGHSQGTTLMFALLSKRPEYSNNINAFVALAPVAFVRHAKGLFGILLPYLYALFHQTNANILPFNINEPLSYTIGQLCKNFVTNPIRIICRIIFDATNGPDHDETLLTGFVFAQLFQATSLKTLAHFSQIHLTDRFEMFIENSKDLHQPAGPDRQYDLGRINLTSMVFFRANNDYLSDRLDQEHLLSSLKVPLFEDHVIPDYNHDDFLWGKNRTQKINLPIIDVLKRLAT